MVRRGPFLWTSRAIAIVVALLHLVTLLWRMDWSPPGEIGGWFNLAWGPVASAAAAVMGFHFVFEKWLWRWPLLRGRLVCFPDLTGTWFAKSHSVSFDSRHYSVVTIDHRFDRLIYNAIRINEDGTLASESVTESCTLERPEASGRVRLFVVYHTKIGSVAAQHGRAHHGCAMLELRNEASCSKAWKLLGEYWTNKAWEPGGKPGRGGTRGEIEMEWKRRELASEADADVRRHLLSEPGLRGPRP